MTMKETTRKNQIGHVKFRLFYVVVMLALALSECSFTNAFQMASLTAPVRKVQDNSNKVFGSGEMMRFQSIPRPRNTSHLYMSAQVMEHTSQTQSTSTSTPSLAMLQHSVKQTVRLFNSISRASWKGAKQTLRRSWWVLPMFLALVPVYCAIVHQANAVTPSWWKLVKVDSILKSDSASLLVGAFLLSNLSYFFSGLYLLFVYPKKALMTTTNNNNSVVEQPMKTTTTPTTHHHHHHKSLASWMLAAGAVSTIFHAVQALGPYEMAESFCYLDHAVALSAGGYFLKRCGNPSLRTWAVGGAGLTLLCLNSGYAFLHSAWHFVSAAAAVAWAHDGMEKKKVQQQVNRVFVLASKPATV